MKRAILFAAMIAAIAGASELGRAQDRTMLVLDRSASMARTAAGVSLLEEQRDLVAAVIAALPQEHRVGIASFASGARLEIGLRPLLATADRAALQGAAGALVAGGGSSLGDGLDVALGALRAAGAASGVESIVLLTDGGDTGSLRDARSAVLPDLVARGVRVFAFGLDAGADGDLLGVLASASGGRSAGAVAAAERARGLLQALPRFAASARVGGFDDLLSAGRESRFAVPLEGEGSEAVFAAMLPSRDDAFELEVITPSRLVIRSVSHIPGVEFVRSGALQLVRVEAPEAGTWSLRVRADPTWIGARHARAEVLLAGRQSSGVDWIAAPRSVEPPATARIAARVRGFAGQNPPRLEAQWIDASGALLERFELRDEGSALDGDLVSGDETFGALFAGFGAAGRFRLRVLARGERDGVPILRCDDLEIDVGAPRAPLASFLRPLALHVRAAAGAAPENRVRLELAFDWPPGGADPSSDELALDVGGLQVRVPAGTLAQFGTRLKFRDDTTELALDAGAGGGSSAHLELERVGLDGAVFGELERVPIALAFGALSLDAVLLPRVDARTSQARWSEGDALEGVPWQVLECRVDRRGGALSCTQRLERDLFDPTADDLLLEIEGFAVSIPAGSFTGGPRRYRFEAAGSDRALRVDLDLRSGELAVRGKGLRFFGSPDAMELGLGIGTSRADLSLRPQLAGDRSRY